MYFFVGCFNVVRMDGDHCVFGCGGVSSDELDVDPSVGRGVAGHPTHVEILGAQPKKIGVKALRRVNVSHPKVGRNTFSAYVIPLPSINSDDGLVSAVKCSSAVVDPVRGSVEGCELVGMAWKVNFGNSVDELTERLASIGHELAAGQDQAVDTDVQFSSGELFDDVAEQPATLAREFNQGKQITGLVDDPGKVPFV